MLPESYISYSNQIYERSLDRIEGLARLLVFEKFVHANPHEAFIESRKNLRGRAFSYSLYGPNHRFKGDLTPNTSVEGLKMIIYDAATVHIPYGAGWDARKINQLVHQTVGPVTLVSLH